MEQFMLIFHGGADAAKSFSSAETMQAHMGKWFAWIEKLKKNGQYVSGEALLPGGKFITGSGKTVTDGPYTEGKEVVGGYFIIKAKDMNEAIGISTSDFPEFEYGGSVQVRQVMKL